MKRYSICILLFSAIVSHSPLYSQNLDSISSAYIFASLGGHTIGFPALGVEWSLGNMSKASHFRIKTIISVNPLLRIINSGVIPFVILGKSYCFEIGAGILFDLYANVPEMYGGFPRSRLKATILIGYRYQAATIFFQ